ncbi:hypothetical protein KC727_00350 [Candidatus Kaiserbacteria bacterium]|nr:hypothetical protein [Candidatus Kaiserbacteria bacterium]
MSFKKDILKIVKHVIRKSDGYPDRRLMHPAREWSVGVGVAIVAFVAVAAFSTKTFLQYSRNTDPDIFVDQTIEQYKQKRAQSILEEYNERSDQFDALRSARQTSALLSETETATSTEGE